MADRIKDGGERGGNAWLTTAWITITALLLLTPLAAMQFTDEVNWTVGDFAIAALLLVGSGITYELAARTGGREYQAGVVAALGTGVLTIWVTGAVGIIGSENNPGNQLYLGVVVLALIGAAVSGGRARGMMWATTGAAVATVLAPVIAYLGVAEPKSDVLAPEVFGATGVLMAGWFLSAALFRRAASRNQ